MICSGVFPPKCVLQLCANECHAIYFFFFRTAGVGLAKLDVNNHDQLGQLR